MPRLGHIAGQTPLDEEEKRDLIPTVLVRGDLDRYERENILQARAWAMQKSILAKQNLFTEKFLLSLHKRMFGAVWKWAGAYRKTNKSIGVDARQIRIELRKLLDDTEYWREHRIYPADELAVIFHHRLVKIHLFVNGNGRHARLVADMCNEKCGGEKLTWGSGIADPAAARKRYIAALREADGGDHQSIVAFARS